MNSTRLETFLARLLVDAGLRAEFLQDPRRVAAENGLEGDEQEALAAIDRPGLLLAARSLAAKRSARSSAGARTYMAEIEHAGAARNWPRLEGVDILRGLAILLVLMNHVNMRLVLAKLPYTGGLPDQLVNSVVWNGQYGVQMFFAVSGFLITATSLRRWGSLSEVSVRGFYALRFARIAPLLLLLLATLSALHAAGLKDFVVSNETGGLGRALVAALTFHVNVLEAHRGYLPGSWDVLWSLSVEELFYLFFPLLCRAVGRDRGLAALLLVFVVLGPFGRSVFAHGNEVWGEYSYLGGMDAIALGCLTALALARVRVSRPTLGLLGSLGIALLIFTLGFARQGEALGLGRCGLDMTICAIGTCLTIALAAQTRWSSPRLIAPLLRLGQHSYEVYLTHMFVVFVLFDLFVAMGSPLRWAPALFIGSILVAGVLGELVARFYSEPMNRLLRTLWGNTAERLGSVIEHEARSERLGTAS